MKGFEFEKILRFYGNVFVFFFLKLTGNSGLMIRIENTYGNDTRSMRDHLKSLKARHGPVKALGSKNFEFLLQCFNPSIEQIKALIDILVTNSNKYLFFLFVC